MAVVGAVVLLSVLTLLGLILLYNQEGGLRITREGSAATVDDYLSALIEPVSIDSLGDRALLAVTFTSHGSLTDDAGRLRQPVRVVITTADSTTTSVLRAGAPPGFGTVTVPVSLDGTAADYPFDVFEGQFIIGAYQEAAAGSEDSAPTAIPVTMDAAGGLYGWTTTIDLPAGATLAPAQQWDLTGIMTLSFERTFTTRLFALVLLTLMGLVAAASLYTSVLVAAFRRPMEAIMLAWTASIVFALPVLRNALPGAPPIGAAIDVFLFFWALLAAMAALVLATVTWLRVRAAELRDPARPDPAPPGPARPPGSP